MEYIKFDKENELLQEISKYKRIMIYSCDEMGKVILRRLRRNGYEVESFITTEQTGVEEMEQIPIYRVDEILSGGGISRL